MDPGLQRILRKVAEEVHNLKVARETQDKRIGDLVDSNAFYEQKIADLQSALNKQAAEVNARARALRGQLLQRENELTSAQLEISSQKGLASYYKAELEKERASGACGCCRVVKLVRILRRCCGTGNRTEVNGNDDDSYYGGDGRDLQLA